MWLYPGKTLPHSASNQSKTSLRRYISEMKIPAQTGLFDEVKNYSMKYLINDIDELLTFTASNTLQQLFQQLISKMGILKYIMEQPNKGWYMQVLTNFFDFLKDESRKNPDIKLAYDRHPCWRSSA